MLLRRLYPYACKNIMLCILILLSSYALKAQTARKLNLPQQASFSTPFDEIQPLTIGDVVPDIDFTMVNYSGKTAKLSDFKGKLVILDFWATWCVPCISSFHKLDSLQAIFKGRVQVILVNGMGAHNDKTQVFEFFEKRKAKTGKPLQLPSAIYDSTASLFFPHTTIPHCVWITPQGKVMAITMSELVTAQNIEKVLTTGNIKLPIKKEFDPDRPLQLLDDITINNLSHYSIFLKGKQEGLERINTRRISNGVVRGRAVRNMPLLEIYRAAIKSFSREFANNDKKILLEVSDSSKLLLDKTKTDITTWEKENLYSYDIIVPESDSKELPSYILQDINRYSDYYGRIEKRKIKCLALTRTSNEDKIKSKGGEPEYKIYNEPGKKYLANATVAQFVAQLDNAIPTKMLVIDETGYAGNIDVEFSVDLTDLTALRNALRRYNLDLVETEREINMFIITEKKK